MNIIYCLKNQNKRSTKTTVADFPKYIIQFINWHLQHINSFFYVVHSLSIKLIAFHTFYFAPIISLKLLFYDSTKVIVTFEPRKYRLTHIRLQLLKPTEKKRINSTKAMQTE